MQCQPIQTNQPQQAKLEEGLAEWKIMKEENQKMEEEIILEP